MAGIVGNLDSGVLDNVKNNISVEINMGTNKTLGGLVATSAGTTKILNSSNHATVMNLKTTTSNKVIIGGIIGKPSGDIFVKNSYNEGELKNGWRIGGISSGVITASSHLIIDTCHNSANITSNPVGPSGENIHIGGLVGLVWESSTSASVYIINSYNSGEIKTTDQKDAGGLVGGVTTNANAFVYNSYNAGKITGQGNGTYAAGILNYSGTTSRQFVSNNVFNYGDVSGTGKAYTIGNLATTTYTISNTYYNELTEASNKTVGTGINIEYFNNQEFVDILNSNISTINLDASSSKKLSTDYGVTLCQWKLGDKGYPEIDC
jgi:hypothetical protein